MLPTEMMGTSKVRVFRMPISNIRLRVLTISPYTQLRGRSVLLILMKSPSTFLFNINNVWHAGLDDTLLVQTLQESQRLIILAQRSLHLLVQVTLLRYIVEQTAQPTLFLRISCGVILLQLSQLGSLFHSIVQRTNGIIFCFVISPIVIMLPKIIVCFMNVGIVLSYNVDAKVSKIY